MLRTRLIFQVRAFAIIDSLIGLWGAGTILDGSIEASQNAHLLQLKRKLSRYRLDILRLSDIRWWDSREHSPKLDGQEPIDAAIFREEDIDFAFI